MLPPGVTGRLNVRRIYVCSVLLVVRHHLCQVCGGDLVKS